jgi:poly-beta-1,6 N-acetyl-D-glucosamine synthase
LQSGNGNGNGQADAGNGNGNGQAAAGNGNGNGQADAGNGNGNGQSENGELRIVTPDGQRYLLGPKGNGTPDPGAGGRLFLVRYLPSAPDVGGLEVLTSNLQHQGAIPNRRRHKFPPNAEVIDVWGYRWWGDRAEAVAFGSILIEAQLLPNRKALVRYLKEPEVYTQQYWMWRQYGRPTIDDDRWVDLWNEPVMKRAPGQEARRLAVTTRRIRRLTLIALAIFVAGAFIASWLLKIDAGWLVGSTSPEPPAIEDGSAPTEVPAIIDFTADGLVPLPVPDQAIALTFDDGPDPVFTDQVLDVLARHDVPATFFVIGERALEYTGVIRRIAAEGHELGAHSWNHPRLGELPDHQIVAQNDLTRRVIAGVTGTTTTLIRPPYSTRVVPASELAAARILDEAGWLVVLSDLIPRDYDPGITPEEIFRTSLPEGNESAIVTLHDSGGERSATVAALDLLIPELKARGYEFMTVSEYADVAGASAGPELGERLSGMAVVGAAWIMDQLAGGMPIVVIAMGALLILRFVVTIGVALWVYRRDRNKPTVLDLTQGVSIIVPAFNEAAGIEEALRSLLHTRHPGDFEVIVVDDGSTDDTAAVVERLALPHTRVIRQTNAGKPVALNTGIANAANDIVVLVDGDTVFEPTTIEHLIAPFTDERVGAVSGNPRVANRRRFLGQLQHVEYLRGCSLDRRMQGQLGMMWCVPGAVGAFRKSALEEVGMVPSDTLAEDTDVTVALRRRDWKVEYAPKANAYTEVPTTWRGLWKQRFRWSYGILQVDWKTRRSAPGDVGWYRPVIAVYLLLMNLILPLLGPIFDLFGVLNLFLLGFNDFAVMWLVLMGIQVTEVAVAARLDGVPMRAALWGPAQILVFRQLIFSVTVASLQRAFLGRRANWNKAARVGIKRQEIETIADEHQAEPQVVPA